MPSTFRQALWLAALLGLVSAATGCVHHVHEHPTRVVTTSPPPWAPAHGHRHVHGASTLVFDVELGCYTVVGHSDHFFHHDHYYRWHGKRWERAVRARGPWRVVSLDRLPPGLRSWHHHRHARLEREARERRAEERERRRIEERREHEREVSRLERQRDKARERAREARRLEREAERRADRLEREREERLAEQRRERRRAEVRERERRERRMEEQRERERERRRAEAKEREREARLAEAREREQQERRAMKRERAKRAGKARKPDAVAETKPVEQDSRTQRRAAKVRKDGKGLPADHGARQH